MSYAITLDIEKNHNYHPYSSDFHNLCISKKAVVFSKLNKKFNKNFLNYCWIHKQITSNVHIDMH